MNFSFRNVCNRCDEPRPGGGGGGRGGATKQRPTTGRTKAVLLRWRPTTGRTGTNRRSKRPKGGDRRAKASDGGPETTGETTAADGTTEETVVVNEMEVDKTNAVQPVAMASETDGLNAVGSSDSDFRRAKGKRSGHAHNRPPRDFRTSYASLSEKSEWTWPRERRIRITSMRLKPSMKATETVPRPKQKRRRRSTPNTLKHGRSTLRLAFLPPVNHQPWPKPLKALSAVKKIVAADPSRMDMWVRGGRLMADDLGMLHDALALVAILQRVAPDEVTPVVEMASISGRHGRIQPRSRTPPIHPGRQHGRRNDAIQENQQTASTGALRCHSTEQDIFKPNERHHDGWQAIRKRWSNHRCRRISFSS